MVDLFGRPVLDEPSFEARPPREDEWQCIVCEDCFDREVPPPIIIVTGTTTEAICSDVCASAAQAHVMKVRVRRAQEDAGLGWQLVCDVDGRPVAHEDAVAIAAQVGAVAS